MVGGGGGGSVNWSSVITVRGRASVLKKFTVRRREAGESASARVPSCWLSPVVVQSWILTLRSSLFGKNLQYGGGGPTPLKLNGWRPLWATSKQCKRGSGKPCSSDRPAKVTRLERIREHSGKPCGGWQGEGVGGAWYALGVQNLQNPPQRRKLLQVAKSPHHFRSGLARFLSSHRRSHYFALQGGSGLHAARPRATERGRPGGAALAKEHS